jgi:uncharacterized protein (DUF849 family)
MHKVWIEAALNGPWSRKFQPGIPDTVETIITEGVACARAGATIVHLHAYDGGGPQTYDWQVYARIIEGIRNQINVPVYPSFAPLMLLPRVTACTLIWRSTNPASSAPARRWPALSAPRSRSTA